MNNLQRNIYRTILFVSRHFRSSIQLNGGGGGGRPGGKPAFNWKDKQKLDLEYIPKKKYILPKYGDYSDLEKHLDLSQAQIIPLNENDILERVDENIVLTTEKGSTTFHSPVEKSVKRPQPSGTWKQVQVHMLFGPQKTAFKIPGKGRPKGMKKVQFSHKRIFGQQKMENVAI